MKTSNPIFSKILQLKFDPLKPMVLISVDQVFYKGFALNFELQTKSYKD